MAICNFKGCERKHYYSGFCDKHVRQFKKGQLLADGTPTDLYKAPIDPNRRCIIKDCSVHKPLLMGGRFCVRHVNWFKSGACDIDGNMLREVKVREVRCLAEGCTRGRSPHKNGLCKEHFDEESKGFVVKKRGCKVCGKEGHRKLGFCDRHYKNYKNKIIDIEGNELRDFLRKTTYAPTDQCRVRGCRKHPVARSLCGRHYKQFMEGWIDQTGRPLVDHIPVQNIGQICSQSRCNEPSYCKLLCKRHYRQFRTGTLGNDLKPVRKCTVAECNEKFHAKSLCLRHYRKMKYMLGRGAELSRQTIYRQENKEVLRQKAAEYRRKLKKVGTAI